MKLTVSTLLCGRNMKGGTLAFVSDIEGFLDPEHRRKGDALIDDLCLYSVMPRCVRFSCSAAYAVCYSRKNEQERRFRAK